MLLRTLMIMMVEGPSTPRSDQLVVYWGAYEGACEVVPSWIEDGNMVYNHHCCLMRPMLPLFLMSANVVDITTSGLCDSWTQWFGGRARLILWSNARFRDGSPWLINHDHSSLVSYFEACVTCGFGNINGVFLIMTCCW